MAAMDAAFINRLATELGNLVIPNITLSRTNGKLAHIHHGSRRNTPVSPWLKCRG